MFDEDEPPKKKSKAISPGKPASGKCLCGKIAFEIDVPARWAWHDHSAASRRAHGAAYATYVGSWRKRFRITRGKAALARYEDAATKTTRSFCATCGTPVMYERARAPHMVNIPRALFSSRTGREPLYHNAIEELQDWAYTGAPLVPLKGFPGWVWQRAKRKRRAGDDPFERPRPRRYLIATHRAVSILISARLRQGNRIWLRWAFAQPFPHRHGGGGLSRP